MAKFNDISGQRFGRLLVTTIHSKPGGRATWWCICDCGVKIPVKSCYLRSGHTASCGCLRSDVARKLRTTHGNAANPTYSTWVRMWQRCTNPKNERWASYGGRGISVCERWLKFENFLADMGKKPKERSIDRINNDLGYSPDNCRWATSDEQMNNTSRVRLLTAHGKTQSLTQWAKELGIPYMTIVKRADGGLPIERIIGPSPYKLRRLPNVVPEFHRNEKKS